jgi:long-chain acyl-CoA synthetase
MNLAHWMMRAAAHMPDRPALFLGRECIADYADFARRAAKVAGGLRAQGIDPGDRVAILMKNTPEYLICLYGIWLAGAAAVPVNARLHPREVSFILSHSQSKMALATPDLGRGLSTQDISSQIIEVPGAAFEALMDHPALEGVTDRDDDALAWLFYTSGTTGRPKGVVITHGMLRSMALCYEADVDAVRPEDAALYAAPLSHGAGLYNLMHVRHGARHVFPPSAGFDPFEILELSAALGSVHMFAAPTMVKRLTDVARSHGLTCEGLRTVVYAGGPMYTADIVDAVDQFGPVFVQIYGQGECPMGITALPRQDVADRTTPGWEARLASVGRAQSAVEVMIGDQSGHPLSVGSQGEIMVRGATVMPGYWRASETQDDVLTDGWLRTGDVGRMDDQGYLTLLDRSKDMIITGGSNVYPREVEEVLLTHPAVEEAAVIGQPHPEWGEEVIAFVVGAASDAELDALCLDHIARFKRPEQYRRMDALPKNNYGKVLKTALREMLAGQGT